MENEKQGLVKSAETRLPKFVEDAYESVEKMEQFANILLNSKLVPNHFYEQLPDKKPDFSKGKVPAVVAVLIQGYQLQLPPLTALQHIIPVNGLLSIKGDLAKSMIFNSGKLKTGSWVEEETGSIENGDYAVKITATRSDNGQTLSRSFSVEQAKRAGLWITEQKANGQDGWKYKSSAWWKYPTRMCNYRALGFIARDMFPDVMSGIYTTEEAMDIPKDAVEIIETETGAKITIPDKEHTKERSDKMTSKVASKIPDNKFGEVKKDNIQEAEVVDSKKESSEEASDTDKAPFVSDKSSVEYMNGVLISRDESGKITNQEEIDAAEAEKAPENKEELIDGQWTLEQMEKMDTEVLKKMVMDDMDMMEASEIIPGKNTNKKLREIIFAYQSDNLAAHVAPYLKKKENIPPDGPPEERADYIAPNKEFDQEAKDKQIDAFLDDHPPKKEEKPVEAGNKYNMEVPAYDKGEQRDFATTKTLYNRMVGVTPQITSIRYLELAEKLGLLEKYKDKEVFCRDATVKEINQLLNAN